MYIEENGIIKYRREVEPTKIFMPEFKITACQWIGNESCPETEDNSECLNCPFAEENIVERYSGFITKEEFLEYFEKLIASGLFVLGEKKIE